MSSVALLVWSVEGGGNNTRHPVVYRKKLKCLKFWSLDVQETNCGCVFLKLKILQFSSGNGVASVL